ncbi:MAG: 2,3-bisphosphoglycerate-independent phosphoglycerate mutase [Bacteroidia bacterium]|nr:2,3-bisphosphoglycerate-independent phosphoglycerate mutase [Bacteroidia bacterium]
MNKKAAIVVLDGWGIGRHDGSDAVWAAQTPFTEELSRTMSHTTLRTDGENVGLPHGQMGNSEVGHMNIGAGRIVWQMLVRINKAFKDGEIETNVKWKEALSKVTEKNSLHLIGLVSDGGVHSHMNHLVELCNSAEKAGIKNVYIHAFLDGRDTDPKSGAGFLETVISELKHTNAKLSTVVGRYYAMDRDKRWERVSKAYHLLVQGEGAEHLDAVAAIKAEYLKGTTDEFMLPIRTLTGDEGLIKNGDVVLCFNYRTDRGRQITTALSQENFEDFGMKKLDLEYYTMTEYDDKFKINGVLFENQNLSMTLGEVIGKNKRTQLRAAETEKYPHVSFFFSGGQETPFEGETRLLVNSPKVATYDLQPEMNAPELTEKAIEILEKNAPDFVVLNYANADMVGHTGVFPAIVKAVETVDACLEKLIAIMLEKEYQVLVIADHGNADFAVNDDGTPNTAHSLNPVPCWLVSKDLKPMMHAGILADVAPTILKLMEIEQPMEMTGKALF